MRVRARSLFSGAYQTNEQLGMIGLRTHVAYLGRLLPVVPSRDRDSVAWRKYAGAAPFACGTARRTATSPAALRRIDRMRGKVCMHHWLLPVGMHGVAWTCLGLAIDHGRAFLYETLHHYYHPKPSLSRRPEKVKPARRVGSWSRLVHRHIASSWTSVEFITRCACAHAPPLNDKSMPVTPLDLVSPALAIFLLLDDSLRAVQCLNLARPY